MKKFFQKRGSVALVVAIVLAAIFYAFPKIDIAASHLFYENGKWLLSADSPVLWWSYRALPIVGKILFGAIFLGFLLSFFKKFERLAKRRRYFLFLLIAALLGPVTFTESAKYFYGRPRPVNSDAFGGPYLFRPCFELGERISKNSTRPKNYSFVSGHVSAASFIFGFFWFLPPARRRRAFLWASLLPIAVAFTRMIPGGHYLSDCIFGFFVTYFAFVITEKIVFPKKNHGLPWIFAFPR